MVRPLLGSVIALKTRTAKESLVVVAEGVGVSILPALFVNTPIPLLMIAASLVGVAVGVQETVFRALVARLA